MSVPARFPLKLLRTICKWAGWAMAAVVFLTLACWWLLPDETLDPAAARLLAPRHGPPFETNGQFAIWGLRASPGMDPSAAGRAFMAEHERLLSAKADLASFDPDRVLGPTPLAAPKFKPCNTDERRCLANYRGREKEISAESAKAAVLLQRYRSLMRYTRFVQTDVNWAYDSPFPNSGITGLSALVDASIALQVQALDGRQAALEELAAEAGLWRNILMDSDTVFPQMLAAAMLQRKYALASEIMEAYPELAGSDVMAGITTPLPLDRMRLGLSLDNEFRQTAQALLDLDGEVAEGPGGLQKMGFRHLMKRNATVNAAYAAHLSQRQFYAESPARLWQRTARGEAWKQEEFTWDAATVLYNPIGKILLASQPRYGRYAFRMYDLVAASRLVDLQRRAIAAHIAPQARAQFVASSPSGLMDPYTGRPLELDSTAESICFTAGAGQAGSKQCVGL